MGITPQFTLEDVKRRLNAFTEEVKRKQIARLQILGEMCVTHARGIAPNLGFRDQTGNLRSSIGYMVFVDGVAVHGKYDQVPPKEAKDGVVYDGAKQGEALAKKVGERSRGISLVVTAGMSYALHVEAKGRDVVTSAQILAERALPKMLEQLVSNIEKTAA